MYSIKHIPNILSLYRVIFVWVALYIDYLFNKFSWLILGLLLSFIISDILDGWIARHYKVESNSGCWLDPLCDKLTVFPLLLYAVLILNAVPLWYIILLLIRDVTISIYRILLRKKKNIILGATKSGKVSIIIMALYIISLYIYRQPNHLLLWISIGMLGISWIDYIFSSHKKLITTK